MFLENFTEQKSRKNRALFLKGVIPREEAKVRLIYAKCLEPRIGFLDASITRKMAKLRLKRNGITLQEKF
jgi:hypothetical protein